MKEQTPESLKAKNLHMSMYTKDRNGVVILVTRAIHVFSYKVLTKMWAMVLNLGHLPAIFICQGMEGDHFNDLARSLTRRKWAIRGQRASLCMHSLEDTGRLYKIVIMIALSSFFFWYIYIYI